MTIYQEITFCGFTDAFRAMGRKNQFTYNGLKALYEYLDQLSEDIGEPINLDVIALCCEYTEYESLEEFKKDYNGEYETIGDIERDTTVIHIDDESFIIQQF